MRTTRPRPVLVSASVVERQLLVWADTMSERERPGHKPSRIANEAAPEWQQRGSSCQFAGVRSWTPSYRRSDLEPLLKDDVDTEMTRIVEYVSESDKRSRAMIQRGELEKERTRRTHNLVAKAERGHLVPYFKARHKVTCLLCTKGEQLGRLSLMVGVRCPRANSPDYELAFDAAWSSAGMSAPVVPCRPLMESRSSPAASTPPAAVLPSTGLSSTQLDDAVPSRRRISGKRSAAHLAPAPVPALRPRTADAAAPSVTPATEEERNPPLRPLPAGVKRGVWGDVRESFGSKDKVQMEAFKVRNRIDRERGRAAHNLQAVEKSWHVIGPLPADYKERYSAEESTAMDIYMRCVVCAETGRPVRHCQRMKSGTCLMAGSDAARDAVQSQLEVHRTLLRTLVRQSEELHAKRHPRQGVG